MTQTMIGESPEFLTVLRAAQIVAATDVSVLINGESGTGKELLAREIHQKSPRHQRPFIAINCGALPENLAESELFGHRKGAFTGATHDYSGKIKAADGGTLFLDEVGELPLSIQVKLLRFLEEGECQTLGQTRPEKVNVRLIAATNKSLQQASETGTFRPDLYYRLNVVPLELPPLRQRTGDIAHLIHALSHNLSQQHQLPVPHYTAATLTCLEQYQWAGNIRELRNFCERMLILSAGQTVQMEHLPADMRTNMPTQTPAKNFQLPTEGIHLGELETSLISQALSKTRGNRARAAKLLGLTRDTLIYRIKKYALS